MPELLLELLELLELAELELLEDDELLEPVSPGCGLVPPHALKITAKQTAVKEEYHREFDLNFNVIGGANELSGFMISRRIDRNKNSKKTRGGVGFTPILSRVDPAFCAVCNKTVIVYEELSASAPHN